MQRRLNPLPVAPDGELAMKAKQLAILFVSFILILGVVLFPPYRMTILTEDADPRVAVFFRCVYTFNPAGSMENGIMYQGDISYPLLFGIIATISIAGTAAYLIASRKQEKQPVYS